jgi:hypothetical protein
MKVTLKNGAEFDFLTPAEHKDGLDLQNRNWFLEMQRGTQSKRFVPMSGTVNGGAIELPPNGTSDVGPNAGFVWAVQRISCQGLAGTDTLQIYRNNPDPSTFIGQMSVATPWFHLGSRGFILKGGDSLVVTGAALTATAVVVNGEYSEVPESQIWKLL